MNLPKYSRGFTIIELLISMSIIAIIAGGIVPTFSSYIRNQNLKQAQEQLKSDLRTLQNRALTGSLSNQEVSSGDLVQYWGVRFLATGGSGTSMQSFVSSGTNCPPDFSTNSIEQNSFNLPNGAKYYINGGNCMFFDIRNGDISGNVNNPIELRLRPSGDTLLVRFNPSGLIWTEVN